MPNISTTINIGLKGLEIAEKYYSGNLTNDVRFDAKAGAGISFGLGNGNGFAYDYDFISGKGAFTVAYLGLSGKLTYDLDPADTRIGFDVMKTGISIGVGGIWGYGAVHGKVSATAGIEYDWQEGLLTGKTNTDISGSLFVLGKAKVSISNSDTFDSLPTVEEKQPGFFETIGNAVGGLISGIAKGISNIFSSNNKNDDDGQSSGKPIIIDLDGDGIEVAPKDQNFTLFDFDDDGFKERTAWVGSDDGLLMFDQNNNGEIDTAAEIAFSQWIEDPELTDLEALAAYFDVNGDGLLNDQDVAFAADDELVTRGLIDEGTSVWDSFKIWQDLDSDAEIDTDELKTLAEWNITELKLSLTHEGPYALSDGSIINGFFDVTMNGETQLAGDVSLAYTTFGLKESVDADGNEVTTFESGDEAVNKILKAIDAVDYNALTDDDFDLGDDDTDWQAATGNAANNTINASLKTEDIQLKGGDGNDSLTGGSGNDVLIGEGGIDTLDGGAGDDLLVVDQDDDFANMSGGISGGAGYDTLIFQGEGALDINLDALGIESATGGDGNDIIDGDNSNLSIYSDYASFDEDGNAVGGDVQIGYHMDGGKGDDTLDGANNDDRLIGGEGADTLWGQGGNDQLVGGADNDTLNGGSGNDSYFYTRGDGDDTITDIGGDTDVLALSDVELSDLELASVDGDLVITIMDREADLADGTITIENWTHEHQRIEYLQLSDGTVVEIGNLKIDGVNTREQRNDIAAYYYNLDASQSLDHLGDVDWAADEIAMAA